MKRFIKYVFCIAALALAVSAFPKPADAAQFSYQWITQENPGAVRNETPKVARVYLKNTGTATWCRDCGTPTRLGTDRPKDRGSGFANGAPGWLGTNRISMKEATIAPNQTATFEFTVKPFTSLSGTYREYFTPVVDGVTWMPDIGIYWDWTVPAPVGTLMFQWYGPGEHRWGGTVDNPNFGTVSGHYSSNDANVRRQQLQAISDAGFDYVALDWWFEEAYGQGAYIRANAIDTAQMIRSEFPQLKYAFFIEPRPWATTIPQYAYDDFYNTFGDDPQWQRYQGKKLLMTFGSMRPGTDSRYSHISYDDNRDGTSWWMWSPPRTTNRTLVIHPSFDNRFCCPPGFAHDPTWTGSTFNEQRDFAMAYRGQIDNVLWYGWNEHYERSQIEPNDHYQSIRVGDPNYIYWLVSNFNKNMWKQ